MTKHLEDEIEKAVQQQYKEVIVGLVAMFLAAWTVLMEYGLIPACFTAAAIAAYVELRFWIRLQTRLTIRRIYGADT